LPAAGKVLLPLREETVQVKGAPVAGRSMLELAWATRTWRTLFKRA